MHALLQLLSFTSAIFCFLRFFWLTKRLAPERTSAPSPAQFRTGWIPGGFTPRGMRIRQQMTILFVLGFVFLAVGLMLAMRPAA
jgi:hypothetical protein